MKILILGGTAWLGSHIARVAIERGHSVTCLARGRGVPDGARAVRADRDKPGALAAVTAERWDAVLDVARQPGHVRRAAHAFSAIAGQYVFVSTGNVYASQEQIGADESAELLPPLAADTFTDPEEYGPAKVACEEAVVSSFGPARFLIARAGLIGGPGDPTGRTDYWPWRFAHPAAPGAVLVPAAVDLPAAVIDVRDLSAWLVRAVEQRTHGIYNAMGDAVPFPAHIAAAREAAGSAAMVVEAAEAWLQENQVAEWSGPRSLPLWLSDRSWYAMNARSTERARLAGLVLRPLEETLRDSLRWREAHGGDENLLAGLRPDEERELLVALTASRGSATSRSESSLEAAADGGDD